VSDTDDLAELGHTVSDLAVSEHLGDSGGLGDFVGNLDDLSSVGMSRSANTKSVVREGSPVGGSGRLGKRVIGDTTISSAQWYDE
jgi:hypothetical protein